MSGNDSYYIVRGAKMQCSCGSNKRKINLPMSHGSYVKGKPIMNKGDNKQLINITPFGVCISAANPIEQTVSLLNDDGQPVVGKICCPMFLSEWLNAKENTLVEGKGALTTESVLICAYTGQIKFIDNGQQE